MFRAVVSSRPRSVAAAKPGSFSQALIGIVVNDSGEPSTDGPLAKGYAYDLDAYHAIAGPAAC
jgi:hypothetical protein